ncbi:unnamed protein product, partial [Rotaria magnacalcarata]
ILRIRAKVEHIDVTDESLQSLADIGNVSTLRYAVQLMTPANILARINGKDQIEKEEIDEVRDLFLDAKSSALLLKQEDANIAVVDDRNETNGDNNRDAKQTIFYR